MPRPEIFSQILALIESIESSGSDTAAEEAENPRDESGASADISAHYLPETSPPNRPPEQVERKDPLQDKDI